MFFFQFEVEKYKNISTIKFNFLHYKLKTNLGGNHDLLEVGTVKFCEDIYSSEKLSLTRLKIFTFVFY